MTVKGRKSFDTIIAEAQFKTAIKVLGGEYLYEKEIYKTPKNSYESPHPSFIDFVVGLPDKDGNIMCFTGTGVELKTSMSDLKNSAYGKNFSAFMFNYLLVPEGISARAAKYMDTNGGYEHVGLLVLCDDGQLIMQKEATALLSDEDYEMQYKSAFEEEEFERRDAVAYLLCEEEEEQA